MQRRLWKGEFSLISTQHTYREERPWVWNTSQGRWWATISAAGTELGKTYKVEEWI